MIRTLNDSEIAQVLDYEQLIPAMERALAAFSAGQVTQPVRTMITVEAEQRFLGLMPAVMPESMGAKLVCFYPKNAAAGLPTHLATIVLFARRRCPPPSRATWHRRMLGCWPCSVAACRRTRTSKPCATCAASMRCGYGAAAQSMRSNLPRATERAPWKRKRRCGVRT